MQQTLSLNYEEVPRVCGTCWNNFVRSFDGVTIRSCIVYGYRKDVLDKPDCKYWKSESEYTKKLLEGL